MELRHLRYFVAVAEEMNVHKAAKRLNISQPPLSLTIKQLEEEIGVNLFDRIARSIRITRAGESFLEYARSTLYQSEEAKKHTRLIGEGRKGVVKIGFISSAITGILQQIVLANRQVNPDIELDISQSVCGWLGQMVVDRRYDIALIREPEYLPKGLRVLPLTKEHWSVACQESHAFSKLKSVSIEKLAAENPLFYPRYNNPGGYDSVMALFHAKNLNPRIIQEAPEQMTIAGLVASGLGVGIVPACMQKIALPGLCHIPLEETENSTGFSIVCRNEEDLLVSSFLKCLKPLTGMQNTEMM